MSIFKKEYWIASWKEFSNLKKLAFAALICALTVVLDGTVKLPLGAFAREVKVTFFIIALGCSVYGPIWSILMAVVVDTMSFFLFASGFGYFPGYMLTEIIVSLIYCFFLYRQKITVTRLFFAKLYVNATHVLLNSLWAAMMMGKAYLFYFWSGLVKNVILLPIEVIILAAFFAAVLPFFSRVKLLPVHDSEALRSLQVNASIFPVLATSFLLGGACSIYYAVTKGGLDWPFYLIAGVLIAAALALLAARFIFKRTK